MQLLPTKEITMFFKWKESLVFQSGKNKLIFLDFNEERYKENIDAQKEC